MKQTLNVLKTLAEENRLRIFMALEGRELCVCQIIELIGLAPSTTSKHLSLMYQAGIIDQRKDGRWAYYRLNSDWKKKNGLVSWIKSMVDESSRVEKDRAKLELLLQSEREDLCKKQLKRNK